MVSRCNNPHLLLLFGVSSLLCRLVEHPYGDESQPAHAGDTNAGQVGPGGRDLVAVGVLVVRHVADGHGVLLLEVGQEGSLVVGDEVVDAMVIGDPEGHAEDTRSLGRGTLDLLDRDTVQGGQHAELELQLVTLGNLEVPPPVPDPLGDGDLVSLESERISCRFMAGSEEDDYVRHCC